MNVWHGDKSMAMIRTNAGRYNERYDIKNMFDKSSSTFWYSDSLYSSNIKIVTIDFFVSSKQRNAIFIIKIQNPINFRELKIQKPRGKQYQDQYLNVCLMLNNEVQTLNCTSKNIKEMI